MKRTAHGMSNLITDLPEDSKAMRSHYCISPGQTSHSKSFWQQGVQLSSSEESVSDYCGNDCWDDSDYKFTDTRESLYTPEFIRYVALHIFKNLPHKYPSLADVSFDDVRAFVEANGQGPSTLPGTPTSPRNFYDLSQPSPARNISIPMMPYAQLTSPIRAPHSSHWNTSPMPSCPPVPFGLQPSPVTSKQSSSNVFDFSCEDILDEDTLCTILSLDDTNTSTNTSCFDAFVPDFDIEEMDMPL